MAAAAAAAAAAQSSPPVSGPAQADLHWFGSRQRNNTLRTVSEDGLESIRDMSHYIRSNHPGVLYTYRRTNRTPCCISRSIPPCGSLFGPAIMFSCATGKQTGKGLRVYRPLTMDLSLFPIQPKYIHLWCRISTLSHPHFATL